MPYMSSNGLSKFAFHTGQQRQTASALDASVATQAARPAKDMDPETAARMYVQQALASTNEGVLGFTAGEADGRKPQFRGLGVEKLPLTGTQTVKFRQYYRGIPVYGSLVTVELDDEHKLLALNSALATPDVDPVADFSVRQVVSIIREHAGYPAAAPLDVVPAIYYYYAPNHRKWYLVYVAENIPKFRPPRAERGQHDLPEVNDYVICAHTGVRVAELPRTMTATERRDRACERRDRACERRDRACERRGLARGRGRVRRGGGPAGSRPCLP